MCFVNVLFQVVASLKFYKCYFIKAEEINSLGLMDLKIYSLERNPRL